MDHRKQLFISMYLHILISFHATCPAVWVIWNFFFSKGEEVSWHSTIPSREWMLKIIMRKLREFAAFYKHGEIFPPLLLLFVRWLRLSVCVGLWMFVHLLGKNVRGLSSRNVKLKKKDAGGRVLKDNLLSWVSLVIAYFFWSYSHSKLGN